MTTSWASRHLSLANARDDRPTDLSQLLRRLADELDQRELKPDDILDVTISSELTSDGPWWSASVYWSEDDEAQTRG